MDVKKKLKPEKKLIELESKWKRALADYHNLEKRIVKEKESFVKFSNAQLLQSLLPVLDDFERAEEHLKDQGLSLAINKLKEVLKNEGVLEIKAQGEEFNPELMEVVEMIVGPKNKVVEVSNKGYFLDEKVLRPAKVKVGAGEDKS
ncbi:nucleotide exchange factor GrpE [Candidatus Shapirobacteria bacterium]|nr:nucleotide exchange factor GrpE [Candidatus Shapirobacteria bacterium]